MDRLSDGMRLIELFKILTILSSRLPSLNLSLIETNRIEDSLWPIMLSLTERLFCIKERELYLPSSMVREVARPIDHVRPRQSLTESDGKMKKSTLSWLPLELLTTIFSFLPTQQDLLSCTQVSTRWNQSSTFLLYRHPNLTSMKSIDQFLQTVEHNHHLSSLVRNIQFGVSPKGSLSSLFDAPTGCDEIMNSHSALFRLLVWERTEKGWTASHPALIRIVEACGSLEGMAERLGRSRSKRERPSSDDADPESESPTPPPYSSGGLGVSSSSSSSSTPHRAADLLNGGSDGLLTSLVKSTQRVVSFSRWCGVQPTRLLGVGIFLLELLSRGGEEGFWRGVPRETVLEAKRLTVDKYRRILNALSTVILTEVQYITTSSQRLLNAYCMVYYRALAHANGLNLTIVLNSLRNAANELQELNTSGAPIHPPEQFVPTTPAGRILQALQLIFHQNLQSHSLNSSAEPPQIPPPEPLSPTIEPTVDLPTLPVITVSSPTSPQPTPADSILNGILTTRSSLREALISFAPGSLNAETAELVERLVHDVSDDLDGELRRATRRDDIDEFLETVEMAKCVRWIREVVRWQRAGREMEPVKDLLRRSMGKIDLLRGVQRGCGVQFMD
ncbi:hypothetical protein HDU67_006072 [Dinochytrium kinnereticum]|nr:hypothetical protein HDU67_006072 [Dinochytrium kinnereticum]